MESVIDNIICPEIDIKSHIKNETTEYVDTNTTSNFTDLRRRRSDHYVRSVRNHSTNDIINTSPLQNRAKRNNHSDVTNITTSDMSNCEVEILIDDEREYGGEKKQNLGNIQMKRKEVNRKKRFALRKEQEEEVMKIKSEKKYQGNNDNDENQKNEECREKEDKENEEIFEGNVKSRADAADRLRAERVKQLSADLHLLSTSTPKGFLLMR